VDYTLARSAVAVPSRACAAVRVGGELPSIGLFTGVRGRGILRSSPEERRTKAPGVSLPGALKDIRFSLPHPTLPTTSRNLLS
jgi:hypothetical protein